MYRMLCTCIYILYVICTCGDWQWVIHMKMYIVHVHVGAHTITKSFMHSDSLHTYSHVSQQMRSCTILTCMVLHKSLANACSRNIVSCWQTCIYYLHWEQMLHELCCLIIQGEIISGELVKVVFTITLQLIIQMCRNTNTVVNIFNYRYKTHLIFSWHLTKSWRR